VCQSAQAAQWLERQEASLLPAPYFHLVFTLPHELNRLIQQNQSELYNLLFEAAAQTVLQFGRNNLGVQLGITAVLHTWSQTLFDHYHVHCIVTGGGLALDGSGWKPSGERFLFPVRALSKVFRGRFCAELCRRFTDQRLEFHGQLEAQARTPAFAKLVRQARKSDWNVYAKAPFAGPEEVLKYLSRYTHRVAITPSRLLEFSEGAGTVQILRKVRRDRARPLWKPMTLSLEEFLRRFCLHLLPERFVKIRHYGLLANNGRGQRIAQLQATLGRPSKPASPEAGEALELPRPEYLLDQPPKARWPCPNCGRYGLILVEVVPPVDLELFDARDPP
jgi:hypothetical protein